ncbi:MAG: GTP-binding protein [Pseudomonadota bacterium]
MGRTTMATTSHDRRVAVLTARCTTPLRHDEVASLLDMLNDLKAPGCLRAKAILEVAGEVRPVVVHAVQDMVHDPVQLLGAASERRGSRLVIITWDIPVHEIRARLPAAFRETG